MERQTLIKGTLILGFAGVFARFLGVFFRWPIIMLIGDEGMGYYQMPYPLYMFYVAVASGVPVAISKMVSEKNAMGDMESSILVLRKALILMTILGGGFSLFLFTCSGFLINFLKWDHKAYFSLIGISLAPLFISVMSAFRGFFQGLHNMNPTAVSEIIEQIGRVFCGVSLAFILLPNGIEYSAGGAAFGAAAGGILGGIYLISKYFKIKKGLHLHKIANDNLVLEKLLYIAIPISLGATVSSIMSLIDSILVPQKLLDAGFTYKSAAILYGQLTGKAFVLVNVPLTLSIALCASLVPIISESYILNKRYDVVDKVEMSAKLSLVIGLPSLCGLFFMAGPILNFIFPGQAGGADILKYLSLSIPFIIMAQSSTAVLQGIGRYILPVIDLAAGCIVKIILTNILVPIPQLNIYGAVIGTVFGYIVSCILNMIFLSKILNISLNLYEILIKPAVASILMITCVVFIYMYAYNYTESNVVSCLVSLPSGMLIYILLVLLFGIFKLNYVKERFFRR